MIKVRFQEMKNAYGIGELRVNYKGDSALYQSLIYSSNGTFKTSFSRALNDLSKGNSENIKDRLTNQPATIKIQFIDENSRFISMDYNKKFIVFSRELYESDDSLISSYNEELSLLTVDNDSKKRLSNLMNHSVEKIKESLQVKLKKSNLNVDKSINCLTNKNINELNINDLQLLLEYVKTVKISDISKIKLKNLFQKAYSPIDSDDFKQAADNYVYIFSKRLNEELFDEKFNDSNCLSFLEEVNNCGYLNENKKRGLVINGKEYYQYDELVTIFQKAINNISKDPSVLNATRELIKSMGTSVEAKKLQQQFNDDPLFINQLSLGKKQIIAIALKQQNIEIEEFIELITETKKEFNKILKEATGKQSEFENAIRIYKNRFNPVFDISISNKEESILGVNVPILTFKHNRNRNIDMSESDLRLILSSGEKTALNIIAFIVEYEANKNNNPVLVLDDLVETFDYANRHAFIEYINDLVKSNVSIIILTHNYEFYRTLARRIPGLEKLSAYSKNGKVTVEENKRLNVDIERVFEITNSNQFIHAIPFLREVKMMIKENTDVLDKCLHYKEGTKNITISMIRELFPRINYIDDENENYLSLLYKKADGINVNNQYDIVPKTILAIACRLKLEQKIIGDNFYLVKDINSNQLAQLKEKYKNILSDKTLNLIEMVQIATPEFIHCNSFMYEPLIDIDGSYLLEIYNKVKALDDTEIWK